MPSFSDWLRGSWADYRRRWGVLLGVAGVTGAAALAGGFAAFLPAALATMAGVGPAWAVWGLASLLSILTVLWLSSWAQAAVTLAAMTEDKAADCLSLSWRRTGPFAWVLTLTLLAVAGGYFLLIVPGMILSVLLFFAAFYQVAGEAEGVEALALSWGRVRPRFGLVCARVAAAGVLAAAPGWIPYVGWLIAMFWTPFGIVALARLARDLREAEPAPRAPARLGAAVAALSVVFVAGTALLAVAAARAAAEAMRTFNDPGGLASRVKPETMQKLMDSFTGQGTEEQKNQAYRDLLTELRSPAAEPPSVSTGTAP